MTWSASAGRRQELPRRRARRGSAGLAAAVYASSEGLTTLVVERFAPGGRRARALESRTISASLRVLRRGSDPAGDAQARKFGAVLSNAHEASDVSGLESGGSRESGSRTSARAEGGALSSPQGRTIADCRPRTRTGSRAWASTTRRLASRSSNAPWRTSSSSAEELGRPGGGQLARRRGRGRCRRTAAARTGDVAISGRPDRGQVERPRLVRV